ncbi:IclR family transcriptional regulator [Arthrobacter sp. UYEF20]|uniref:IclR family transcriptional regulator n=1 Tax=Arthrobacter sp. UYEF20 TaxID=1756363 RepID=UPI0033982DAD
MASMMADDFSPLDPESGAQHGGVQSVDRAITVLEILARTGDAGVSEIAEEMGVHKSTASRLLSALDARGMVQQNSDRGKYQLGFNILRLASAIPARLSVVKEARPELEDLVEKFGETVNLAVLRSHYAVNVDQAMGPSTLATQDWIGGLTPLHATSSGKVLLAALAAEARNRVLAEAGLEPYTQRTITSRDELEKQLAGIADAGYATVYEELEPGLNAVAVPVRNHRGAVVGSVSISGPAFRFDPERIPGLIDELKQAGHSISAKMGYIDA